MLQRQFFHKGRTVTSTPISGFSSLAVILKEANLVYQTSHENRKIPKSGQNMKRKISVPRKKGRIPPDPHAEKEVVPNHFLNNCNLYFHPKFEAVFKGTSPGKTARKRAKD